MELNVYSSMDNYSIVRIKSKIADIAKNYARNNFDRFYFVKLFLMN